MKKITLIIAIILSATTLFAQDTLVDTKESLIKTDVGMKITSRHYWRGIPVSSAPCFEGALSASIGGFTLGYWGGYAFDNTYSEFDIFASYSVGNFSIGFVDLYVIGDENNLATYHPEQKYWHFDRTTTAHNIDVTASYVISEKFPLKVALSSMVWGGDRDANGDQRYSTYLELGYPVSVSNTMTLDFFLGAVLNNGESAYGDSAGIVHAGVTGTKQVALNKRFALPVSATLAMNPQKQIGFLILAVGI